MFSAPSAWTLHSGLLLIKQPSGSQCYGGCDNFMINSFPFDKVETEVGRGESASRKGLGSAICMKARSSRTERSLKSKRRDSYIEAITDGGERMREDDGDQIEYSLTIAKKHKQPIKKRNPLKQSKLEIV